MIIRSGLVSKMVTVIIFFCLLSSCANECEVNREQLGLSEDYCPSPARMFFLPQPAIERVNIFLETSGSMSGLMPADGQSTSFQIVLADLLSRLNSEYPGKVKFFSISSSGEPVDSLEWRKAKTKILGGEFNWDGSTYLPSMLDTMVNYSGDKVVNLFISDCIFSPEKKDTKQKDIADSDLRTIFKKVSSTTSTSILCLFSEFRKKERSQTVSKSPYYFLVNGKTENLQSIESSLLSSAKKSNFEIHQISFGREYSTPYYSVLSVSDMTGNFIADKCDSLSGAYAKLTDIDASTNDSLAFWVALNLKNLPAYATDTSYLKKYLSTTAEGQTDITQIRLSPPETLQSIDKTVASKATTFVKIKISGLAPCSDVLNISLKAVDPDWMKELHEPENESNREKTYGLLKIITGIAESYNQGSEKYFFKNLSISLIKK